MRRPFHRLAFSSHDLIFGQAKFPVSRNGVVLGAGAVIPEIKFTLPPMTITENTFDEVKAIYSDVITGVCQRAVELHQQQIIVEFELLPEMTMNPAWGESITLLLKKALENFRLKQGLKYLLRVTPVDVRELQKPPKRIEGRELEWIMDSFRRCATAGGDLLSIESTGGKEVTDLAVMSADIRGVIFGTGILACADMEFLWERICEIAGETGTVPAGDTACGIGNTAMILADQGYIPKVFAAVVRAVTAARSLVAYEVGATGPGKDCGYENAIIKAVTGFPMSLEGRSAACAHFSSIGNIAGAYADLWSNESVQQVKLLSGMAPVVSMEQLIYDCRLFNVATRNPKASDLRDWFVESDARWDPQAFILTPEAVVRLANILISESDDYRKSVHIAREAIEIIDEGYSENKLVLPERERTWLGQISSTLDRLPEDRHQFIIEERKRWEEHVDYSQYRSITAHA